uniref:Uncharacterized protein n=1 Tax=Lepeophtheirus salmonis TaxID=72036 RepID=A0A0K2U6K8_LEPSM
MGVYNFFSTAVRAPRCFSLPSLQGNFDSWIIICIKSILQKLFYFSLMFFLYSMVCFISCKSRVFFSLPVNL